MRRAAFRTDADLVIVSHNEADDPAIAAWLRELDDCTTLTAVAGR